MFCAATCRTAVREQPRCAGMRGSSAFIFSISFLKNCILFLFHSRGSAVRDTTEAGAQVYSACVHVQMGNLDGAFLCILTRHPSTHHHPSDVRRGDKISGCGSDACSPPSLLLPLLPSPPPVCPASQLCVPLEMTHTRTHTQTDRTHMHTDVFSACHLPAFTPHSDSVRNFHPLLPVLHEPVVCSSRTV